MLKCTHRIYVVRKLKNWYVRFFYLLSSNFKYSVIPTFLDWWPRWQRCSVPSFPTFHGHWWTTLGPSTSSKHRNLIKKQINKCLTILFFTYSNSKHCTFLSSVSLAKKYWQVIADWYFLIVIFKPSSLLLDFCICV